jgi:hypothetical protein
LDLPLLCEIARVQTTDKIAEYGYGVVKMESITAVMRCLLEIVVAMAFNEVYGIESDAPFSMASKPLTDEANTLFSELILCRFDFFTVFARLTSLFLRSEKKEETL